jgi:hypothetical protein
MALTTALFYLSSALILFCAVRVVTSQHVFRAALYPNQLGEFRTFYCRDHRIHFDGVGLSFHFTLNACLNRKIILSVI